MPRYYKYISGDSHLDIRPEAWNSLCGNRISRFPRDRDPSFSAAAGRSPKIE